MAAKQLKPGGPQEDISPGTPQPGVVANAEEVIRSTPMTVCRVRRVERPGASYSIPTQSEKLKNLHLDDGEILVQVPAVPICVTFDSDAARQTDIENPACSLHGHWTYGHRTWDCGHCPAGDANHDLPDHCERVLSSGAPGSPSMD